jgi:DNA-binding CsgD family transcriptional regulator
MPVVRPRPDAVGSYRLSIDEQELEVPREGELLIGRASDCALQLKGGLVSRHHARLRFDAAHGLLVEDLQSRNGVTVNGAKIEGAALVGHGDVIGIGLRSILLFDAGMSDRAEHLSTLPPAGGNGAPADGQASSDAGDAPTMRVCLSNLSARERAVLELIVRGFTQKEMAQQLFVSVKTVETYRARLAEKLGCQSRAELVTYAIAAGILREPAP